MSTIDSLYTASTTKTLLIQSSEGVFLVQAKLDNGWYLTKPLAVSPVGYSTDASFVLIKGDQAIWSAL